jgi:hypothetical protein
MSVEERLERHRSLVLHYVWANVGSLGKWPDGRLRIRPNDSRCFAARGTAQTSRRAISCNIKVPLRPLVSTYDTVAR